MHGHCWHDNDPGPERAAVTGRDVVAPTHNLSVALSLGRREGHKSCTAHHHDARVSVRDEHGRRVVAVGVALVLGDERALAPPSVMFTNGSPLGTASVASVYVTEPLGKTFRRAPHALRTWSIGW